MLSKMHNSMHTMITDKIIKHPLLFGMIVLQLVLNHLPRLCWIQVGSITTNQFTGLMGKICTKPGILSKQPIQQKLLQLQIHGMMRCYSTISIVQVLLQQLDTSLRQCGSLLRNSVVVQHKGLWMVGGKRLLYAAMIHQETMLLLRHLKQTCCPDLY